MLETQPGLFLPVGDAIRVETQNQASDSRLSAIPFHQ